MALGAVVYRMGAARLTDLSGLGRLMPWTMGAFTAGGLSLIGFPLTAGFISKWYLIQAVLELGGLGILLTILILVSSLMAVVYIWKVVEVAYFKEPIDGQSMVGVREAPMPLLVVLWMLVLANIWFGIDPSIPITLAEQEAAGFFGGTR